jgi:hypothetical protein
MPVKSQGQELLPYNVKLGEMNKKDLAQFLLSLIIVTWRQPGKTKNHYLLSFS